MLKYNAQTVVRGGLGPSPNRRRTLSETAIDIEKLLVWTYQNEVADVLARRGGSYVPTKHRDSVAAVAARATLGCRVQNGGPFGYTPYDLHPDAEMVHEAVKGLSVEQSGLVIELAKSGTRPDWVRDARPRTVPILRANGKPKMEYVDPGTWNRPAYCLVRFDPDPSHVTFQRSIWVKWWDTLALLAEKLDGELERKVLGPPFPREPWEEEGKFDAAR